MRERGPRGARIEFLGPRWDTPKFFTRSFGAHQTTKSGDHGRLPSGSGQKEWPGAHRRVKAWSLGVVLRVCHGAQADHPRGVFISDQRPPTGHQLQRACATTLHLATMCAPAHNAWSFTFAAGGSCSFSWFSKQAATVLGAAIAR